MGKISMLTQPVGEVSRNPNLWNVFKGGFRCATLPSTGFHSCKTLLIRSGGLPRNAPETPTSSSYVTPAQPLHALDQFLILDRPCRIIEGVQELMRPGVHLVVTCEVEGAVGSSLSYPELSCTKNSTVEEVVQHLRRSSQGAQSIFAAENTGISARSMVLERFM